ncbi:hypothetical protein ASC65_15925 [Brevundimonas sp. Root1279]|nr:hypothetical protein ASC65_15925 [Brevundimonas sp. Root1279]
MKTVKKGWARLTAKFQLAVKRISERKSGSRNGPESSALSRRGSAVSGIIGSTACDRLVALSSWATKASR